MTQPARQPLRYIHIEDHEADATLVQHALRTGGYEPHARRVDTADSLAAALQEPGWDLILADWTLPQFSAPAALEQITSLGFDLPVIIVTGAVGEETAVEALKAGAHNYVMKDRLVRLVPAIQQALREGSERNARRHAEGRLYALARISPVGIFLTDRQGIYSYVNLRWCALAGLSHEQALNNQWEESLHPDDRRRVVEEWRQAVAKQTMFSSEYRFQNADGSVNWVLGQAVTSRGMRDELLGYIGTVTDITERKKSETALQSFQDQIRQMQKMEAIGQLAGGVAHDFNNILTAILGNAEMAAMKTPADHPARPNLTRILEAGARASHLVQQILTFTHQQEFSRTVLNLTTVIHEALNLLQATLPANIKLTAACETDAPPVLADATQIHQVVMNLCTNAWHALKGQPGQITMELTPITLPRALRSFHATLQPGHYARLSIRDTGCGMEPETVERIFDPFFTTKPVGQGTGLGLSVVHGIIRGHEGAIVVESRPGQGTTFHLYFPAAEAPALAGESIGTEPAAQQGRNRHLLYLDDEEMLVELVRAKFESLGYRVTGYTKPTEALDEIRADPAGFDIVVTDYNMPGMSGLEVASALAQLRADLPVVLVSGYLSPAAQAATLATGIKEIVYKPTVLQQLESVIARLLDAPPLNT